MLYLSIELTNKVPIIKKLIIAAAFILLAGTTTSCQEKIDIEKEKEAIKAVIEKESNSHLARDNDRHNECFVQDERLNHRLKVTAGVLAKQCSGQLRDFFARRRVENAEQNTDN